MIKVESIAKTASGHVVYVMCITNFMVQASKFAQTTKLLVYIRDLPLSNLDNIFFLIRIKGGGVQLGPLCTATTDRPIVPAPGDYDDGEIGGMMIGGGHRSTRRKPAPVPLYPPQIPHAARTRTRAAAVGSQRLTA
jgi:hypothetical protein